MLDDHGLPQPDAVEYGQTCVRLFWQEEKVVMVVQIDEPPPGWMYADELSDDELARLIEEGGGDG